MVRPPSTSRVEGGRSDGVNNSSNNNNNGGRYKGVRMRKWGKWVAEVRQPNSRHRIWLGSYESPEKAARAYDAAVFCLRGPSAAFNFPDSPLPEISSATACVLSPSQIQVVASRHAHCVRHNAEYEEGQLQCRTSTPLMTEIESSFMVNSSFGGFPSEDCYVPVNGGGGEVNLTAGGFYQTPRVWRF